MRKCQRIFCLVAASVTAVLLTASPSFGCDVEATVGTSAGDSYLPLSQNQAHLTPLYVDANGLIGGYWNKIKLHYDPAQNPKIQLWDVTKENVVDNNSVFDVPGSSDDLVFWVEGISTSSAVNDVTITATLTVNDVQADTSSVNVTVVAISIERQVDGSTEWHEVAAANNNVDVLPGQLMHLRAAVTPSSLTMDTFQWTFAGNVFKDYTVRADSNSTCSAILTNIYEEDRAEREAKFYWADTGNSREVTCDAAVQGQSCVGKAQLNVKKPVCTSQPSTGSVEIGSTVYGGGHTAIGLLMKTSNVPSMQFRTIANLPAGYSDPNARWHYVQLITPRISLRISGATSYWPNYGKTGLDTSYPYEPQPYDANAPGYWDCNSGGMIGANWVGDSPMQYLDGNTIPGLTVAQLDHVFKTYIMFRPSGDNSRYVPLASKSWPVAGTATLTDPNSDANSPSNWTLSNATSPDNSAFQDDTSHPVWTYTFHAPQFLTDLVTSNAAITLVLSTSTVTKGATGVQGTVSVPSAIQDANGLVVNLSYTGSGIQLQGSTVTIAHNASSATFNITVSSADPNSTRTGTETATITAAAQSYVSASAQIVVRDPLLRISAPTSVAGNAGHFQGVVSVAVPVSANLTVNLTSDKSRVTVPATVTIPANSSTVAYTATVAAPTENDRNISVTLTAKANNYAGASAVCQVTDN